MNIDAYLRMKDVLLFHIREQTRRKILPSNYEARWLVQVRQLL